MARRKRSKRGATYAPQATRGHTVTATTWPDVVRLPSKPLDVSLQYVEDRRLYPEPLRQNLYRDLSGAPAQISRRPSRKDDRAVSRVFPALYHRFETPRRVPVCIRRADRRRVLHALRKTGRGSRPGRWTAKSYIRCR